jgi:hypothetical protein
MLMMVDKDVHFHVIPRYAGTREHEGRVFADAGWPAAPALGATVDLDLDAAERLARRPGRGVVGRVKKPHPHSARHGALPADRRLPAAPAGLADRRLPGRDGDRPAAGARAAPAGRAVAEQRPLRLRHLAGRQPGAALSGPGPAGGVLRGAVHRHHQAQRRLGDRRPAGQRPVPDPHRRAVRLCRPVPDGLQPGGLRLHAALQPLRLSRGDAPGDQRRLERQAERRGLHRRAQAADDRRRRRPGRPAADPGVHPPDGRRRPRGGDHRRHRRPAPTPAARPSPCCCARARGSASTPAASYRILVFDQFTTNVPLAGAAALLRAAAATSAS